MKYVYYGKKGIFGNHGWLKISFIKYIWLKLCGFVVKKIPKNKQEKFEKDNFMNSDYWKKF